MLFLRNVPQKQDFKDLCKISAQPSAYVPRFVRGIHLHKVDAADKPRHVGSRYVFWGCAEVSFSYLNFSIKVH